MKKIKIVFMSIVMLFVYATPVYSEENIRTEFIGTSNGVAMFERYSGDDFLSIDSFDINNTLLYRTYYKNDGNIYMLINGEETLAVEITSPQSSLEDIKTKSFENYRAPSNFVLTTSGVVQRITISGSIIAAGTSAVVNALIAVMRDYFANNSIKFTAVGMATLSALCNYIVQNYTTYDTNIIRNGYVYSGCTWLLYNEFVYPEGYTVGAYCWTDNPSLGIAPYACKIASQTYQY